MELKTACNFDIKWNKFLFLFSRLLFLRIKHLIYSVKITRASCPRLDRLLGDD